MTTSYDIAIVGGGLVGLTAALACASKGASVIVLDREDPAKHMDAAFDGRASAIAASSFQMYRHLGIAKTLGENVQPITDILITDGETGQAASPLSLHFDSRDVDGMPMGYMVENRRLRQALLSTVKDSENIELRAPVNIRAIERKPEHAVITLDTKQKIMVQLMVIML
mgnify:FL=1